MNTGRRHEHDIQTARLIVLHDVDRNFLDSDALVAAICRQLTEYGISMDDANETLRMIHDSKGQQLDTDDFMRGIYGHDVMDAINQDILAMARTDEEFRTMILYGYAGRRIIKALKNQAVPQALFTSGTEKNQRRKVEILRAAMDESEDSLPMDITEKTHKLTEASSWKLDQNSLIIIPKALSGGRDMRVEYIVLLDDKYSNLESNSDRIRGIHTNNHGNTEEGQRSLAHIADLLESGTDILELSRWYQKRN